MPNVHCDPDSGLWAYPERSDGRAETSCNFFWGEAWVERAERDLDATQARLAAAKLALEQ